MEPLIKIVNSSFIKNFLVAFPKGNIYLVGGCIRDILLDKESFDFDLVVENVSQDELISFLEEEGNVTTVYGRNFGVVKFRPKLFSIIFDIALPRREKYLPGQRRKHAAVELEGISIYEDLARRDFTINAMALDFRSIISSKQKTEIEKYLIDPFDGLKDLKHKIVRTVGDPKDRFSEDPTRILRGVRFAAQFNFVIEPDTLSAMRELADQVTKKFTSKDGCEVERVSHEMIGVEFTKSLDRDPKRTVELYDQTNLLKLLLPEVEALKMIEQPPQFHSEGDVYTHTLLAISKLPKDVSINVKIATLLHDIGKPLTYKSAKDTGDRVRFNRHDEVGAALARQICQRFCLSIIFLTRLSG
jgi:poly(A) polymerase